MLFYLSTAFQFYSRTDDVKWFNDFSCGEDIYGKKIGPPNTKLTNQLFGGKNIKGTRILFTNGDHDPWSTLSLNDPKKSTSKLPILIIIS